MRNRKGFALMLALIFVITSCAIITRSTAATAPAENAYVNKAAIPQGSGNWTMFRQSPSHNAVSDSDSSVNSFKLLWNFTAMKGVASSPAVVNGYLFAGSNDNAVYCVNCTSGEFVWYYVTRGAVASSPAVANGVVYVGSDDHNIYALNATNGAKLWNYTTGYWVESSPTVVSGVVYIGSDDDNFYALNATSGTKLWSFRTPNYVQSSPAVSNGVVYVASAFNVYALNASTGNEIWSHHTGSMYSSPTLYGGCVYVGSYDGYVCSLNASTGDMIWKYQTHDAIFSSPTVAYGCVYIGSDDNNVYCVNASDGEKIWQSPTGYWVRSSPTIAFGNVYIGSEDYNIYCLNASTGAKEWIYPTGSFVDSSPAIVNNTLYVSSDDSHIYAFELFNSTVKTVASEPTSPMALTTIAFDSATCAVAAVAVLAIVRFAYSNRRTQRTVAVAKPTGRLSWFTVHSEALCILAILVFSVIFFINLGSATLWASDEQTYSQWAFHMAKSGDYLTPWGNGETLLWIGKPPLSMWFMALSYQFLGVNNFTSRISSAIFGSLSLVMVFYLGKKLYNSYVGFLSALILGTFTTFYVYARRAMTDVPFIFFAMAAIYFFVLSDKKENSTKYAALSGLFFGLALMTKQLQALLIPLIIFVYLLATRRNINFLWAKRFLVFLAVGLLIFSPWLIYMSASFGSQFWQTYFMFNIFSRTTGTVEGHTGSYLYYFSNFANTENVLYVILLPFAAGLCLFNAAVKRVKADALILLWIIVVFAVFTFAQTKLYYYILPAFPAFAIAISSLLYQAANKIRKLVGGPAGIRRQKGSEP